MDFSNDLEQSRKEKAFVLLGMELAKLKQEFWYKDLLSYLKGKDEDNHGNMYFCNLKPLYDKYGYDLINGILTTWEELR